MSAYRAAVGLLTLLVVVAMHPLAIAGSSSPTLLDKEGACFSRDGHANGCEYGIGILSSESWVPKFAYGDKVTGHDAQGKAIVQKLGKIAIPAFSQPYIFVFSQCTVKGTEDLRVIAIVRYDQEKRELSDVIWAVRLNPDTASWDKLLLSDVRCYPLPGEDDDDD